MVAEFPQLTGPYLGQNPPGITPEIFAPGIISTADLGEAGSIFTPGATQFIFNRYFPGQPYTIYTTSMAAGAWSAPVPASFNSPYNDWDYNISPDGKKLYFTSKRPLKKGEDPARYGNIWVTNLTSFGWSEPKPLDAPINTAESHDSYASLTREGTLYFFSDRDGNIGPCDIFRAKCVDGGYPTLERLEGINTEYSEYDLYVDPDERYLIFCSTRPGGDADANLYISFIGAGGTCGEPVNMGPAINSHGAVCPSVTLDGKYFFFHSRRRGEGDIYWADAKFIDTLKP